MNDRPWSRRDWLYLALSLAGILAMFVGVLWLYGHARPY